MDDTTAALSAPFAAPPSARSMLVGPVREPCLALVAGDRVHFGDITLTCLGEQNETYCRYVVLADESGGEKLFGEAASWGCTPHASLVDTCWLTRLLAIVYKVARAASVDGEAESIDDLCELARRAA